jgi:hypothetical protein
MLGLPSTALTDSARSLRQMKLVVAILIASNLGLGVFSFFLLRKIDRQYSSLIVHSVPVLNDLQTLTAASIDAMRLTNPDLFTPPVGPKKDLPARARAALEKDRAVRARILTQEWLASGGKERATLEQAGSEFSRLSEKALGLLLEAKLEEADRYRETTLRPVFERYITAVTTAADSLNTESARMNEELSGRVGGSTLWILGLASWPMLLTGALLLFVAVFVLVLMFLFRGKQLDDVP